MMAFLLRHTRFRGNSKHCSTEATGVDKASYMRFLLLSGALSGDMIIVFLIESRIQDLFDFFMYRFLTSVSSLNSTCNTKSGSVTLSSLWLVRYHEHNLDICGTKCRRISFEVPPPHLVVIGLLLWLRILVIVTELRRRLVRSDR